MNANKHDGLRKRPAHGVYISPAQPTVVFLTVCCKNHERWLATDRHHELLVEIWSDRSHWVVGRYVVMPDHLHLFATPQEDAVNLESWVKYWKSQFTKRNQNQSYRWQTDHWDTRMRNERQYEEKSEYVYANPVRAELVAKPNLWPYQGIVHEIRWQ